MSHHSHISCLFFIFFFPGRFCNTCTRLRWIYWSCFRHHIIHDMYIYFACVIVHTVDFMMVLFLKTNCIVNFHWIKFYSFCRHLGRIISQSKFFLSFLNYTFFFLQKRVRETCEAVGSFLQKMLQGEFGTDKTVLYALTVPIAWI